MHWLLERRSDANAWSCRPAAGCALHGVAVGLQAGAVRTSRRGAPRAVLYSILLSSTVFYFLLFYSLLFYLLGEAPPLLTMTKSQRSTITNDCQLPSTFYFLSSTFYVLRSTFYFLLSTFYVLLSTLHVLLSTYLLDDAPPLSAQVWRQVLRPTAADDLALEAVGVGVGVGVDSRRRPSVGSGAVGSSTACSK